MTSHRRLAHSIVVPTPQSQSIWLSCVTKRELEQLFDVTYNYSPKPWVGGTGAESLAKVMGGDDQAQWEQMKRLYASLFSDAIPEVPDDVPPLLAPLFRYVAAARGEGVNIFGNGAGKAFASRLLGLLPSIGPWVRTATTSRPQTDWCGVQTPQLRGVVNVAVVAWLVVGKIKASSFTQTLAGMQAVEKRDNIWPYGLHNAVYSVTVLPA